MKHYATLNHREPGGPPHTHIHAHGSVPGSLYCELEVLQSEQLSVQDLPVGLQQSWPAPRAWESLLLLRTGRTHQVQAAHRLWAAPALCWAARRTTASLTCSHLRFCGRCADQSTVCSRRLPSVRRPAV